MRLLAPDLEPKLWTVFREGYSLGDFRRDALAGIVVGIVALPLAIAFAIASGVRPEQGIYTAITAGFVISAFGGSRVQIGGPTGAFVVIVAGVVARFGYEGLAIATIMAGCLLVLMSVARLGDVIRFIPYPVTVGFTSGIAVIIAASQIGDAFGLSAGPVPSHFVEKCVFYARHAGDLDPAALGLSIGSILVIQLWPRTRSRLPGPLIAIVVATGLVHGLDLDVETIGGRFGGVPSALPSFALPAFDFETVPDLVSPAITIALLAAIESLLSALVADGLTGGRHRSNAELMGQGIANIVTPFFGGIPATGAIARTATNIRNGGRSPIAGLVHAATLAVIVLVAGRYAAAIPLAALSGILLVVAYNMSEWRVFRRLLRGPKSDVLVLIATFGLTVVVDLTVAIQAGVVLASLLFMRRMAEVTQVKTIRDVIEYESDDSPVDVGHDVPAGVEVFEINGSFCFGAARKFTETLLAFQKPPRIVILRMRHVLAVDATGLHALEDVAERLGHRGTTILLSGVHAQPLIAMERSGTLERIGADNLLPSYRDAIVRARALLAAAAGHGADRTAAG